MSKLREDIIEAVDKEFGKGTTQSLSSLWEVNAREWVSTGSLLINGVIHRPGIAVGGLTAIIGKPASGKSTLAQHLICETQRAGGLVILMDTEHCYDPPRAERIGVKNEDVLFYQDLCLEEAFSLIYRVADIGIKNKSPQQITIVLDSHSGTPTKAEVKADEDASRSEMGSSARVTSLHLRRMIGSGLLVKARIALVFVCQLKDNIGGWGAPTTFMAEKPITYHALTILQCARRGVLSSTDGIKTKVKVVKNKVGPPFAECEVEVLNDTGIDEASALLAASVELGILTVKGGGYYVLHDRTFRRKEWRGILEQSPELKMKLSEAILQTM